MKHFLKYTLLFTTSLLIPSCTQKEADSKPVPVRFEKSFEGMYPTGKQVVNKGIQDAGKLSFEGNGVVFKGGVASSDENM
ncbi:MAG: hypothetical protein SOR57_10405 [Parabacteroides sp.]|nr:hypothetical protein [Parabacteroides sp.]